MNPLVRAHIEAERRLQVAASRGVGSAWKNLGSWNEPDVERFLARAIPMVEAAQRQSVAVTDAYLARYLGRAPIGVDPAQIAAKTRNGATLDEVYRRPFVQLWSSLKDGQQFQDGFNAALERAVGSAAMDVQLAMRETADFIDQEDDGFFGYTRVANGDACAFCQEVDGAYVKGDEGLVMPLHNNCNCSLEPNMAPHDGAVKLPDGTEIRPYQYGPYNDNVAVYDHGELGPMLGDPSHEFTAL